MTIKFELNIEIFHLPFFKTFTGFILGIDSIQEMRSVLRISESKEKVVAKE